MHVRRYVVRDMPEAVVQIRRELGKNAIILSTKRVHDKGFLGLWRRKRIEVLAAVGDDVPVQNPMRPVQMADAEEKTAAVKGILPEPAAPEVVSPPALNSSETPGPNLNDLVQEIKSMKQILREEVGTRSSDYRRPNIESALVDVGFSKSYAATLCESFADLQILAKQGDQVTRRDLISLFPHLKSRLADFDVPVPISSDTRIVGLVGPTGVGKTTTIAKLAALSVLSGQGKVGLITTDTFRIAAVDQLKTYADILNVPIEIVDREEDIAGALGRLEGCSRIFVDTSGRNYRIEGYAKSTQDLLHQLGVSETVLVLSLATRTKSLCEVVEQFGVSAFQKFIFTKLDETEDPGALMELVDTYKRPIAYVTTGQNVPDDLEMVSVSELFQRMLERDAL